MPDLAAADRQAESDTPHRVAGDLVQPDAHPPIGREDVTVRGPADAVVGAALPPAGLPGVEVVPPAARRCEDTSPQMVLVGHPLLVRRAESRNDLDGALADPSNAVQLALESAPISARRPACSAPKS